MKRLLAVLLAVLCPLLLGAAPAPVSPDRNFYVSDYASLLTEGDRQEASLIAADLYEQTGIRLVYLSAGTLDGQEPGAYADGVITGWELTDSDVLFFVYEDAGYHFMVGRNVDGVWEGTVQSVTPDTVMAGYRAQARRLYVDYAASPGPGVQPFFAETAAEGSTSGNIGAGTIIFMAVMCIVLARGFRLNRKYKQKYLKGFVRRRKTYTRTYNEEDEYNNEKIYKITYDDQD